eukprot:scaffold7214_cov152-Skeletonema_menzelii.AAC.5
MVAADAAKDLATARKERDMSHRVEVLRAINNGEDEDEDGETIVYGSALFEDGQYHSNKNLWDIALEQNSSNICRLADLRDCHICAGGGFPVATLDDTLQNNAMFEGSIDDVSEGDSCQVSFCFCPHATWLVFLIHGWPREEWETIMMERNADETQHLVSFMVDDVAVQYPDATVEFKNVTFTVTSIHGALKRLLPPKRKEEVRADRDRRIAEEVAERDWQEVVRYVESTLRDRGNFGHIQLEMILRLLSVSNVKKRTDAVDRKILRIITACEQSGAFGFDDIKTIMERLLHYLEENPEMWD